ncbi:SWIM zinc finger domain-containing protein [Paenibacillus sp. TAF43_2]|uniref:SWIM zinc finger family protein n=1 Tax=Paenibacillus sp. TAF43_2 TaxID=3233069 RepID=UPI003F96C799
MSMMHLNEKLHALIEQQLNVHVETTIMKRGWHYYMEGKVNSANEGSHDHLYGVVQGSDLYAVILDAGQLRYSSCTCPYTGFCKHMAAVYFQYCSQQEGGHTLAERSYFRLLGLSSASALLKNTQAAAPPPEAAPVLPREPGEQASAEEWLEWMEATHGDVWRKCRHSLHALQPLLSSLKGLAKDWEKPLQRLHWSTAIIFVLEQAERAINTVDSFSRYYHEMSFIRMAEPWVEHLYTLVSELTPEAMELREEAWADALIARVKVWASSTEKQLFDWEYIYLVLCEKLSESRSWFERELASMVELSMNENVEDVNKAFLHTAIGIMYFFDKQDEKAIAHFALTSFERSQKVMYPCAAQRMEEGKWELVEQWMSFLFERINKSKNGRSVGPFVTLCRRADLDRPEMPIWTDYMKQLLPHSYSELSDHWLGQKRYEEWADLQMLIGSSPEDVGAHALREIAKLAPRALMPMYHQSVESSIQSRNRQGYRIAVKQLKKLERLYKADKDEVRWNQYISGLVSKHQRLRAFQEELWKGKIVT